MMPVARESTTTAARTLTGFWNNARLRADDAKSTSVRPVHGVVPWRAALEDVLNVAYGLQTQCRFVGGAWEEVRWRTTPSAGAIYPFEVIACVAGQGSYLWNVESGRLLECGLPILTQDDVADAGLRISPGHQVEALFVVVVRPWLSMKKYHLRGYAYCHLDVGHVATNLATYANALGYAPTLHLRFSRACMAGALGLDGLCREPLAVLSFASGAPVANRQGGSAIDHPAESLLHATLERPARSELDTWESLRGILSFDSPIEAPAAPASTPLLMEPADTRRDRLVPLAEGLSLPTTAAECRSAILARRSAKGFLDGPVPAAQIGRVLGALRPAGLQGDGSLADCSRLGVRVIARNVDGLSGVFAYSAQRHALHEIDSHVGDLQLACMKQGIAGAAAALLLVHAPRACLLEGYSAFGELHFHAAQLGQRLHLTVARLDGIGMTCIGGFDGERCAELARLDPADEAVYVVLLGIPDESAIKLDRLRVASSHGYTTAEG
jgi:SagB-type dehydrogenase family enzyme